MSIYDAPTITPTEAIPVPQATTMSTSEANQILNNYGVNPTQVLSATNVANTVTNPTVAPDDLLGIRANITKELGLDTQNTAYQNALAAARNKVTELNKTTAIMEGNRVNLGVIRGEQAQARTLATPEIQALQDQAALEQDRLNALTTERDYRVGVAEKNIDFTRQMKVQYAGAGIKFGDSLDSMETKLVAYQKKQKKEAEKDALKSALRQLGLKTSGSSKELESRLSKYSKAAAKDAKRMAQLQYDSGSIDLALKKVQLQKANQENKPLDIASLYGNTGSNSKFNPGTTSNSNSYFNYLNP